MSKYFIIVLLIIANSILSMNGYIRICNRGIYLAKCYVESRSYSYGYQIYKYDTGLFSFFQCPIINLPFDSIWNRLECQAMVFIAVYRTIFIQEFPSDVFNFCYTITGTILNPTWSQTQC